MIKWHSLRDSAIKNCVLVNHYVWLDVLSKLDRDLDDIARLAIWDKIRIHDVYSAMMRKYRQFG